MSRWIKRTTTYIAGPDGKAHATARTVTFQDGHVEVTAARDLIDVVLEEKRAQSCAYGEYRAPTSGPATRRTPTEMRNRAAELAIELGLQPKQERAKAKYKCDCDECLAGNCDEYTDTECDDVACAEQDCPNQERSARPAQGRTIFPYSREALQQQREIDARVYDMRLRMRLAASAR